MKQINITKFGAKNYVSFQEKIEIDVKKGLNFIVGPNGTGKTSTLEIPLVCFFGENSKGDRINDLINNKIGKNCYLYTNFEVIDNNGIKTNYCCQRYGNYKGSNSVVLSEDGQVFKKGHKEVTNEIIRIIGPKKLVTNTIIFPQKASGLFLDLTDSERKDIFSKILGLDNYSSYQKQSLVKEKELNSKHQEIEKKQEFFQEKLSELDENLTDLNKKEEEFKKEKQNQINSLNDEVNTIRKEIKELEDEINTYDDYQKLKDSSQKIEREISEVKSELKLIDNNQEKEIENLQYNSKAKKSDITEKYNNHKSSLDEEKYKRLEEINQTTQKSINEFYKSKNELDKEYNKVKNKVFSKQDKIKEIDSKINSYNQMVDNGKTYCYECYQEVSLEHVKNKISVLEKEKEEKNGGVKEFDSKLNDLINQKNNIESEIKDNEEESKQQKQEVENEINQEISELKKKANDTIQKVDETTSEYKNQIRDKYAEKTSKLATNLSNKNSKLTKVNEEIETINNINNRITQYKYKLNYKLKQLKDKEKETFDESQITNIKHKILTTKDQINELNNSKKEFKKELKIVKFWKEGFSKTGIPSMLIDESVPFMNKKIKEYLDIISEGRYIVSFDTLKETKGGEFRDKISVNVYDNFTGANSKSQLSGGQSRVVDIATVLTLSDLSNQVQGIGCNLKIWDEIFDSLDQENISHVSKVLRKLAKENSIFVVSHQHINEIDADEVLKFID